MFSRRGALKKFLALTMAGGILVATGPNCIIFNTQNLLTSINWTWFLTCRTDTLFTGNGLLVDCGTSTVPSTTSTSTSTSSGLSSLLGGSTSTGTGTDIQSLISQLTGR